jgi:NAD(P)-dependent dehydrogenase (short-subunit alcohol dehydrogenase family)
MQDLRPHRATDDAISLEGRVALVTGGAQGLGAATCRALADAGATVLPADVRADAAEAFAHELRDAGVEAEALELDVSDDRSARDAVDAALDRFGRIDILVNNAGVDRTAAFDDLSVEDFDRVCGVNLRGPFLLCSLVFPSMREHGSGSIVNIVSTAARRAWANASLYHATKWGLLGLSHALHVEGREHGIKVSAVIAGGMRTPFLLDRFPDIDLDVLQDPENVARTIRFLLTQPDGTVIPEVMVLPVRETSWP